MHPTAKRCVQWAAAAVVAGAIVLAYGPNMYVALADGAGANADVGLGLVQIVLTLVRELMFPLGAALIGAAIVIQTLAPGGDRSSPEPHADVRPLEPGTDAR
jgi:hypothetical protein